MHRKNLTAIGTLLTIGVLVGAAAADEAEPVPPLENGFLSEGDPVNAQELEDIFARDVRSQAVVVHYKSGASTVYEVEPVAPAAADEGQATVAPEARIEPATAVEEISPAAGTDEVATAAQPILGMLSEDDIRARVIGNTTTRFLRGGWWTEYYAPDGTIRGRWRNVSFSGAWSVQNEALCFDYAGTRRDHCARLMLDESTVVLFTPDGLRHGRTLSLLAGNPSKL